MKIDLTNPEFRNRLETYIKWIDNPPKTDMTNYDKKRRELHSHIFEVFKIKKDTTQWEEMDVIIQKFIISMSSSISNKKIAMINACKTQEEIDAVNRKFEFLARYK